MVKHALWLLAVVSGVACGGVTPTPVVTPPSSGAATHPVTIAVVDGFHGPLPADLVAKYCQWVHRPTLRTPQLTRDAFQTFQASIAGCVGLSTIALVEAPDPLLAQSLASAGAAYIELGNELELAPYNLSLAQYAVAQAQMCTAVRAVNGAQPLITGAVYTLNTDTKQRMLAARDACPGATLGVHLYEALSQADLDWLAALGVPVAVTETGSPTGCGTSQWIAQANYIDAMIAQLSTVPNVTLVAIYQRPSGTGCTNLDTFGIEDKPAWDRLAARP